MRSIGSLYLLGGVVLLIAGPVLLLGGLPDAGFPAWIGLVFIFLGALNIVLGIGLRQLRSWVRIPVVLFSALGLLQFGVSAADGSSRNIVGPLISVYIMYLVLCQKGKMVLSSEYTEIIRQTPHIKYRVSILIKVLLATVVGLVAIALVGALLSRGR